MAGAPVLMDLIITATSEGQLAASRPRPPTSGGVATRSSTTTPPKLRRMGGGATSAKPARRRGRLLTARVGAEARVDNVTAPPQCLPTLGLKPPVVGRRPPGRVRPGVAPEVQEEAHLAPPPFKGRSSVIVAAMVAPRSVAKRKTLAAAKPANGRTRPAQP